MVISLPGRFNKDEDKLLNSIIDIRDKIEKY